MPEIGQITRQKPVDATVDLGDGDSIVLSFDANKITPRWVADTEARLEDRDTLTLPKALAEVILSWDVTDEGQSFPPVADNIAKLSFPAMGLFFEQIMQTAVPGAAEGNASSDTSFTPPLASTEPQASLQNGPQPSPSAQPSASPSPT